MFNNRNMNVQYLLILSLSIYIIVASLLYIFQRNILYHPTINNYSGEKLKSKITKIKIMTEDNIEIIGWHHDKNLVNNKFFALKKNLMTICLMMV